MGSGGNRERWNLKPAKEEMLHVLCLQHSGNCSTADKTSPHSLTVHEEQTVFLSYKICNRINPHPEAGQWSGFNY